jgi:hypothetical protein
LKMVNHSDVMSKPPSGVDFWPRQPSQSCNGTIDNASPLQDYAAPLLLK